jgi:hypothetical protein
MCEILPRCLKVREVLLRSHSHAVNYLSVSDVVLVVQRIGSNQLLETVSSLSEVLPTHVDVAEFEPGFLINLADLNVLVQHADGVIDHIVVPVKRNEPLHGQLILWNPLQDLQVDFLSFESVVLSLVEHGQLSHCLHVVWEQLAKWSEEDLRPIHLFELEGSHEEFFSKRCKSDIGQFIGILLGKLDSDFQDYFRMLTWLES